MQTVNELKFLRLKDNPRASMVVFDTETTGINTEEARIVEFGCVTVNQDGSMPYRLTINPGIPREQWLEAQRVCGWTPGELDCIDASPTFAEANSRIHDRLSGQIVIGYNILDYDIPLLHAEQRRAGLPETEFPLAIDVLVIVRRFQRHERVRSLSVISNLLGHVGQSHRAVGDCHAALYVFHCAVDHGWLSPAMTIGELLGQLADWKAQQDADWARYAYWLYHDQGKATSPLMMGAGKECGMPLSQVPTSKLRWYLDGTIDFPAEVIACFKSELKERGA